MAIKLKTENLIENLIKGFALLCLLAYVVTVLNTDLLPTKLILPFSLLLGCVGIIALANLHLKFSFKAKETLHYKIGVVFLILAFFQLTVMIAVQQAIMSSMTKTTGADIYSIINSIQLGMDVAFDIFYSVGILFISLGFIVTDIKSIIGWYGLLISSSLLTLNFITFPFPPKDKGLVDLGIFTIIWWFILIRKVKSENNNQLKH